MHGFQLNNEKGKLSKSNPEHHQRKVRNKDKKERGGKKDTDSGRDSNLRHGKWPAVL